jgi:hypothetical protein
MSIIIKPGMLLTYVETEVTCPICEQVFDGSQQFGKSEWCVVNTKCPKCKGKITIFFPIMGGKLECWETECPPTVARLHTETPNKINGVPIKEEVDIDSSKYDEGDEEDGDGDADSPVLTKPPKSVI